MNQKGFTILELIIVIAIITILASILIPAGGRARERARMAKAKSQVSALELAITAFQTDFGFYPTNQVGGAVETNNAAIVELLSGFTFGGGKAPSNNALVTGATWNGPYLDLDVSDTNGAGEIVDPWGNPYVMALDLDGDPTSTPPTNNVYTFDIASGGPDGNIDGTDDLTNY